MTRWFWIMLIAVSCVQARAVAQCASDVGLAFRAQPFRSEQRPSPVTTRSGNVLRTRGYMLLEPVLTRSEQWAVALLNLVDNLEPLNGETRSKWSSRPMGLIAVRLADGDVWELNSVGIKPAAPVGYPFPFGGNTCGFSVEVSPETGGRDQTPRQMRLFMWNLDSGESCIVGRWAEVDLLGAVLDWSKLSLGFQESDNGDWNGRVSLRSRCTQSTVDLQIDMTLVGADPAMHGGPGVNPGQWFSSGPTDTAVIVTHSFGPSTFEISCLDPGRERGLQWKLSRKQLEDKLGGKLEQVAPARGGRPPCKELAFLAHLDSGVDKLFVVNASDGRIVRQFVLDEDWPTATPIVSADGSRIIYSRFSITDDAIIVRNLSDGRILKEFRSADLLDLKPFAATKDENLYAANGDSIVCFDMKASWKAATVFRLGSQK